MMLIKSIDITFQTEGFWQGMPAVFVDCFGCSVGCEHCEEPKAKKYQNLPVHKIHALVELGMENFQMPFVVIGGGEPTDQSEEVMELIELIKKKNKSTEIQVETSAAGKAAKKFAGVSGLLANIWLTVSPVPHKEPSKTLVKRANELKLIVSGTEKNLEFCRYFSCIASPLSKLRYQPMHSKDVDFSKALENSFHLAKEFGGRVSMQWQRFIKLENLNLNKEMNNE
jgi:organic radical activating enzyme